MSEDATSNVTCVFFGSSFNEPYDIVARFLALVTTMVTKVDHGNYGWLPRLVTMVSYLGYQGANYGY